MSYRDVVEIVLSVVVGLMGGFTMRRFVRPHFSIGTKRWLDGQTALGVLVLVMMAVTGALYYQQAAAQSRVTSCQAHQNEVLAAAIAVRAQAATDVDDAQRVFLKVRANPNATPEQRIDSINTYLAALDKIDSTRSDNPLLVGGCR